MNPDDLTREQAAILRERIRPMLHYLSSVERRMVQRHFPPQDQLRQKVHAASDAIHRLWVELHYKSCGQK